MCVVNWVSPLAVKLYCVPTENGVATSRNPTKYAWFANPAPSIWIGVPPVSGANCVPEVGPPVT